RRLARRRLRLRGRVRRGGRGLARGGRVAARVRPRAPPVRLTLSAVAMSSMNRRDFLRQSTVAAAGVAFAPSAFAAPTVLTPRRVRPRTAAGTLVFRPTFVQRGVGPHLLDWAYATDHKWDAFHSN